MVSVIVPVYKVERFLDDCVKSLMAQTEKELQIILVDDGSPDSCGRMCDEYAAKDSRVLVIHKRQGGQSDARNAGLDAATGEYITFMDSDDFSDISMLEMLRSNLEENRADIAICAFSRTNEQGKSAPNLLPHIQRKRVFARSRGIRDLLALGGYQSYLWNKLFKRELFDGVRFPTDRVYEDMATMYKVFHKAERIVYDPQALYFYRQRAGSSIHQMTWEKSFQYKQAATEMHDFVSEHYPEHIFRAKNLVLRTEWTIRYYRVTGKLTELWRRLQSTKADDRETRADIVILPSGSKEVDS